MTDPLEFKQKFVYQENERGIFIPVTLVDGAKITACGAKLDTGPDLCYFSREHAEEVGLQVEGGTVLRVETHRPEQPMIFYRHGIKIQSLGSEIETTVYFWERNGLPRNYFPVVLKGLQGSQIGVHDEENILSRIVDKRNPVGKRFSSGNGAGHHGKY